jgi:hypothetical protein
MYGLIEVNTNFWILKINGKSDGILIFLKI